MTLYILVGKPYECTKMCILDIHLWVLAYVPYAAVQKGTKVLDVISVSNRNYQLDARYFSAERVTILNQRC